MRVESQRWRANFQCRPSLWYKWEFSQSSNFSNWWRVWKIINKIIAFTNSHIFCNNSLFYTYLFSHVHSSANIIANFLFLLLLPECPVAQRYKLLTFGQKYSVLLYNLCQMDLLHFVRNGNYPQILNSYRYFIQTFMCRLISKSYLNLKLAWERVTIFSCHALLEMAIL